MSTEAVRKSIFVRFTRAGFHSWPDAPGRRDYLAAKHRHLFHVELSCEVKHGDREIEFHDLLDFASYSLDSLCGTAPWRDNKGTRRSPEYGAVDFGHRSCEHIAGELGAILAEDYRRDFVVQVSEDDECGATVVTSYRSGGRE